MSAAPILNVIFNGETIKSVPLQGEVLLGRGDGCVIKLSDRAVSREHASFKIAAGGVQVERRSEFAPISVNGAECTRAVIREGDVVEIGPYLLKLQSAPARSAAPAKAMTPPPSQPESTEEIPASPPVEFALENASSETPIALEESSPIAVDEAAPLRLAADESAKTDAPPGENAEGLPKLVDEVSQLLSREDMSGEPQVDAVPDFSLNLAKNADSASGVVETPAEVVPEDAATRVAASAQIDVKLVFPPGSANHAEYAVKKDEITIGRGKDCDVILADRKASRKSALLRRNGARFVLQDLRSANGTFVNGTRLPESGERELVSGDVVRIGNVEFRFMAVSASYAALEKKLAEAPVAPEPAIGEIALAQPEGAPAVQPPLGDSTAEGAILGVGGVSMDGGKRKPVFAAWFKRQSKRSQAMVVIIGILFVWWFMDDDAPMKVARKRPVAQASPVAGASPMARPGFEALSPEKKRFVEAQYALASDYFKNRDYDRAIFELNKIFELVPDYLNARELEHYAQEGKREAAAREEERKRKEEEEKVKARVAELIEEAGKRMDAKDYAPAQELFGQILALDPDNATVAGWRKIIDDWQEQQQRLAQEHQVQEQVNHNGWQLYGEARAQEKAGHHHRAIALAEQVLDLGATDRKLASSARSLIASARAAIAAARDPLLEQAKQAESSGDLPGAYKLYEKAAAVDPAHPAPRDGMNRIRGVLHEKAKVLYTEAVLAESYSDFATARKKYNDCINTAPRDDIYHERAERKIVRYSRLPAAPAADGEGAQ